MLKAANDILTIARNERRMLYRTAKFWVLAGGGAAFVILFIVASTVATIFERPPGVFIMEASDTFIALFFFSFAQAILVIFVAGDFRKAEEKARLDQVMLSRPMTTAHWVIGKYLGVVSALLYLNIFLVLLSTIGRIIKVAFLGIGFNMLPAVAYVLIAVIPAILFITALIFFLVSLFRLQSVAIILSLTYVGAIWFYFHFNYLGLFDYGCFFAPLFPSDLIGFGDIRQILQQRLFFILLAFCLLSFSIVLYPRLRQSKWSQRLARISAVVFLLGAAFVGYRMARTAHAAAAAKVAAQEAQAQWAGSPLCRVQHYDFKIAFGAGPAPLRVESLLRISNPNAAPLTRLAFSLNGGLRVSRVLRRGRTAVAFRQEHQLLILDYADHPLLPGARDSVAIHYAGTVDAEAFMVDILPAAKGMLYKDEGPIRLDAYPAFVNRSFAVLPSASGWYPVPGPRTGYAFSRQKPANFATATFAVETAAPLVVVTQGRALEPRRNGDRKTSRFVVETPAKSFSLNIGPYKKLAHTFKGFDLELYYRADHIRGLELFADVADTCYQVIESVFDVLEEVSGTPYPYPKLCYVEIPLQIQTFPSTRGFPQNLRDPQVIMLDELQVVGRNFKHEIEREKMRARNRRQDDSAAKTKRQVIVRSVTSIFADWDLNSSLYSPVRNYLNDLVDITDPTLDRALEVYLFESADRKLRRIFYPDRFDIPRSHFDEIRESEGWWRHRTVERLYDVKYDTMLARLDRATLSGIRPATDRGLYFSIVDIKGSPVLRILSQMMGQEAFSEGLRDLRRRYARQPVSREAFIAVMQAHTPADVAAFFHQWFDEPTYPGYRITQVEAEKIDTGKMKIAYQVRARVQNGERGDGFVQVIFRTKNDHVLRNVRLAGHEEKEIRVGLQEPPQDVQVLPYFSRNRGRISKSVSLPNRVRRGAVADTVFAVVSAADSLVFFSDDRDDGFFTPAPAEAKYLRPKLKGKTWWESTNPLAYGKYYFGLRYKRAGDGEYPALWETSVPRSGAYDLSFHLPIRNRWWARRLSKKFKLTIQSADGRREVLLPLQETADGWIYLGRFRFERDVPAIVELADEGSGYLLADAIRWEYVH